MAEERGQWRDMRFGVRGGLNASERFRLAQDRGEVFEQAA